MIGTSQMERLLAEARRGQAKVVLVGDPDQLKPIAPGEAFRALIETHGAARLETIYRQHSGWQREASENLATGDVEGALSAYRDHGRVHFTADRDEAIQELVLRYFEERTVYPDDSTLLLAFRRNDAAELNRQIHDALREGGELEEGVRLSGREYSAGDRIVFRRNDADGYHVRTVEGEGQGVQNGTLGTLIEADAEHFDVRLDDGRRVSFDPRDYYAVDHGYASTIHRSQGATVDRAYVLADPLYDRHLSYVALTRHRKDVHLFADDRSFSSFEKLAEVLTRPSQKDLAWKFGEASKSLPDSRPEERLKDLQGAFARLREWDSHSREVTRLAEVRSSLPRNGSLWDLDRALRSEKLPPDERSKLEKARRQADEIRGQLRDLDKKLGALGSDRSELEMEVLRRARGFEEGELQPHLEPRDLATLRSLRGAEEKELQHLRGALTKLRKLKKAKAPVAKLDPAARLVAALARRATRAVLRRLLPAEVQLALSAVSAVRSLVRKMHRPKSRSLS